MISIIIPTYNEAGNIVRLVRTILVVLKKNNLQCEIIIVDDNSPDKSGKIVMKEFLTYANVKVFIRKNERGLASAIYYGVQKSTGDTIIGIDADFNHPPELIPLLIKRLDSAELVIGSRFIQGGGMDEWGRYVGTYLFNWFLRNILGFPTMDNMSGYYAIKRKTLYRLNVREIYRGYGEYHFHLLWYASQSGMTIAEVPVHYKKRMYGKSKSHLLTLFFVYLKYALTLRFQKKT